MSSDTHTGWARTRPEARAIGSHASRNSGGPTLYGDAHQPHIKILVDLERVGADIERHALPLLRRPEQHVGPLHGMRPDRHVEARNDIAPPIPEHAPLN